MKNYPVAILPSCHIRAMEGIIGSLGRRDIPIIALSHKDDCAAYHSRYVKQKLISPPPEDEKEYIDFLLKEVPKGVLFPANDQTTMLLSQNRKSLIDSGFQLNLPSENSLTTGFDKWLCYCHANGINIPCAATKLIENKELLANLSKEMTFPLIIKATTLAGGNYCKIDRPQDILEAYEKMVTLINQPENIGMNPKLIAQQWLEYNMDNIWCVEAFYNKKGVAKGFWPIRKWRTVIYKSGTFGSRLYAGESLEQQQLEFLTKKLLDSLNWRGVAHLDWIYMADKKCFYLTEINPRFPGFSAFPSKAGFDMAYYYYADLIGQNFKCEKTGKYFYFELFRYPGDLTESLGAIFRKQYQWNKLISSYKKIFIHRRSVIIDFFDLKDLPMTWYNLKFIIKAIVKRIFIPLKNHS